jgi:predicted phosphodiesterase
MMLSPAELHTLVLRTGNTTRAAEIIGRAESTLRTAIRKNRSLRVSATFQKVQFLEEENRLLKMAAAQAGQPSKPRVILGKSKPFTILAIGDSHDSPSLDKDRFRWMGKHAAFMKPDRIVHIGDFASWDSMSTHEERGSLGHAMRPSFKNDLDSCEEAMAEFFNQIHQLDIPMDMTAGNHEERIQRFENKNPETVGTLWAQFTEMAARYRWRIHQYGQWLMIDGVGFIHVPMNIMGRPYGGQHAENAIANHATHSIVFGHTHRSTFRKTPKIGMNNSIEIMNLGSSMPDGYIAKYAGTATTGWSYGIVEMCIQNGHIMEYRHISMDQLQERYG